MSSLVRAAIVAVAVTAQVVAAAASGAPTAVASPPTRATTVRHAATAEPRHTAPAPAAVAPSARGLVRHLRTAPVPFIRNDGQADPSVAYYVTWGDSTAFFTSRGLTLSMTSKDRSGGYAVTKRFVGAARVRPVGVGEQQEVVSYFSGSKEDWRTALPTYRTIRYPDVWDGVDATFSASGSALEDTYIVRPGADPSRIALRYGGAQVTVVAGGRLRIASPAKTFFDAPPIAYQVVGGVRRPVSVAFDVTVGPGGASIVRFRIGTYDHRRPLVIDPLTKVYAGYFGGPGIDQAFRVAVDASGAAYLSGYTTEGISDFRRGAGRLPLHRGSQTAFVAKIDPQGTGVVFLSYIGGSGTTNAGLALTVDATGAVYVGGATNSDQATFPVTVGPDLTYAGKTDGFVAKLSPDGATLEYCGYVGGALYDQLLRIVIDDAGAAYVAGETASDQTTLPVTVGPSLTFAGGPYDGVVAKVSPDGTAFEYMGYIGGSGFDLTWGIAVDAAGAAYISGATRSDETTFPVKDAFDLTWNGGFDAYVGKIRADGTGLAFLGYLGGAGDDYGRWLTLGSDGSIFLTGYTTSDETTFPVTGGPVLTYAGGPHDAYVAKIAPGATGIVYCGYLGGAIDDLGRSAVAASDGTLFVAGESSSTDFPVVGGPQFTTGGAMDGWVAHLSADGTQILQSTFLGGSRHDLSTGVALGADGAIYVTGETSSTDLPVEVGPYLSYGGGDFDAYVGKYVLTPGTTITSAPPSHTNLPDATFEFTSDDPTATFSCALDGDPPTPCVTPLFLPALPEGQHTISIVATDELTGPPADWTWVVDTTAPVTTLNKQPKDPTASTTALFAFTSNESGSTFSCSLDGGQPSACVSGVSYAGLADGPHTFAVHTTDEAGNLGAPVVAAWTVETIAPTVTILTGPADPTRKVSATFSMAVDDPTATLSCSLDGAPSKHCVTGVKYLGLADGSHTLSVVATDPAGNTSVPATWTWTVDTTAPTVTIVAGPPDPTKKPTSTFTLASDDPTARLTCSLDGAPYKHCVSGVKYGALADGPHQLAVVGTDVVGNAGVAATWTWTVDTTAPTLTVTSGPSDPTGSSTASFTFTASEPKVGFRCELDGAASARCASGVAYSSLADGVHTFALTATDPAGNQGTASVWTWTVDTVAPTVTVTSGPADPTSSTDATFTFTASEPNVVFACSHDGQPPAPCSSGVNYADIPLGAHEFDVVATDAAGNQGPVAVWTWTVVSPPLHRV